MVHEASPRSETGSFVKVNCGAIPESLLESEFFGYVPGAFTGASSKGKIGYFETADKGTLFLDEIGELPLQLQVKLLSVLQDRKVTRVGGSSPFDVDIRVVAATNRDLEDMVRAGTFREDLYYRLHVLSIDLPPLRARIEDIEELTAYLSAQICTELKISLKELAPDALDSLKDYHWPGNVRELQNVLTRAFILSRDKQRLDSQDLSQCLLPTPEKSSIAGDIPTPHTMEEFLKIKETQIDSALRQLERRFVAYLMDRFNGNITLASRHIGLSRTNFYKMMQRCGYKFRNGTHD